MTKIIEIEGNNFSNVSGFYDEIQKKFSKDLVWEFGRNLDAFNDVLRGGFGVHEYGEPIEIIWRNSEKSKHDLGYNQTIIYLQAKLRSCHPSNVPQVEKQLEEAKNREGKTFFDIILEIIKDHEHIELTLK